MARSPLTRIPPSVLAGIVALLAPYLPSLTPEQVELLLQGVQRKSLCRREAASYLGVAPRTLNNFVRRGWLTRVGLGGRLARFKVDELERLSTEGVGERHV